MTHKSYKLNGRQTVGGFTPWQWAAVVPGATVAFGFVHWAPVPLLARLFFAVVGGGLYVFAVYLSGFLELNLARLARELLAWRRADERYSPGAEAPERALLIVSDERAPAREWVFEPLDLRALDAAAGETVNGGDGNDHGNGRTGAGGNGASSNGASYSAREV
jgi:hypothetical protein